MGENGLKTLDRPNYSVLNLLPANQSSYWRIFVANSIVTCNATLKSEVFKVSIKIYYFKIY